jgi:hypothetical protein
MSCIDVKAKYLGCESVKLQELQRKVMQDFMDKHNENLSKILEPELQKLGIKQPFTKNKMKWHGIKLFADNHLEYVKYQLMQRGKLIKSFTINYNYE